MTHEKSPKVFGEALQCFFFNACHLSEVEDRTKAVVEWFAPVKEAWNNLDPATRKRLMCPDGLPKPVATVEFFETCGRIFKVFERLRQDELKSIPRWQRSKFRFN